MALPDSSDKVGPVSLNFLTKRCPKPASAKNKNDWQVFPRLEHARSINFRLAPRGVVFEGAL